MPKRVCFARGIRNWSGFGLLISAVQNWWWLHELHHKSFRDEGRYQIVNIVNNDRELFWRSNSTAGLSRVPVGLLSINKVPWCISVRIIWQDGVEGFAQSSLDWDTTLGICYESWWGFVAVSGPTTGSLSVLAGCLLHLRSDFHSLHWFQSCLATWS